MKSFLLSLSVNGIKNIENTITLNFYNKTLKRFNPCGSNIKGIFGPNGIGKTAILKGADILVDIVLQNNFLSDNNNILILNKIINKNLQFCTIKNEFISIDGKKKSRYEHFIKLAVIDKNISIIKENLTKKNINSDAILKEIEVNNGIITKNTFSSIENKELNELTKNLLNNRSILNVIYSKNIENNKIFPKNDLKNIINFYSKTGIKLEGKDDHTYYAILQNNSVDIQKHLVADFHNCDYVIPKHYINNFENYINNMCKFLKIFKPDLKNIILDKKENKEDYFINLLLEYDNYKIELEFESMGMKSLISLFLFFIRLFDDGIVFIDEIDLSIHDVYLNKLIEFFAEEGKGQLIFTAHNITLLETLRKYKHSIDFINENKEIVSWVKKGNSNPFRIYKEGYIKGLPFNLDESDFYTIFKTETGD